MRFRYEATGIGSVPFTDPAAASRYLLETIADIPYWPQLPRVTFLENMYAQYAEALPGAVIDERAKTIHVDSHRAAAGIEAVYAKYLENDLEYFRMSPSRAAGFYAFIDAVRDLPQPPPYVKGGVTGPVSFGLTVTDETKRSIFYDRDLAEVLTKLIVMKARWQVAELKTVAPNVIIFIDEPYLVSIGSSYVNINAADAVAKIDEVVAAVKEAGALAGVHCCGNTDWSLLLKRDIDILSFDAYTGAREFALYAEDIKAFAARGGTVAWGIVPSSDAVERETCASLVERFRLAEGLLEQKGLARGSVSSLITPSCGLGSLDQPLARRILEMTRDVSGSLRAPRP